MGLYISRAQHYIKVLQMASTWGAELDAVWIEVKLIIPHRLSQGEDDHYNYICRVDFGSAKIWKIRHFIIAEQQHKWYKRHAHAGHNLNLLRQNIRLPEANNHRANIWKVIVICINLKQFQWQLKLQILLYSYQSKSYFHF